MNKKIKSVSIIIGAAVILFFATFLGSFLAFQSYEPRIKVLLEDYAEWDISQAVEGEEFLVYGSVAGINGDLLTLETKPPENPFVEWQKEITFSVTGDTEIVLGEWKKAHEIIEEQDGLLQEGFGSDQFQYSPLKETFASFNDLEIGRNILVALDMEEKDSEYLEAKKIIIGKTR